MDHPVEINHAYHHKTEAAQPTIPTVLNLLTTPTLPATNPALNNKCNKVETKLKAATKALEETKLKAAIKAVEETKLKAAIKALEET